MRNHAADFFVSHNSSVFMRHNLRQTKREMTCCEITARYAIRDLDLLNVEEVPTLYEPVD